MSISGLQEERPLLNESSTTLLTKLQHDNQMLRYKVQKLLSELDAASRLFQNTQPQEAGSEFRNEGVLQLHSSLQDDILKQPLNLEIVGLHGDVIGSQQYMADNRNEFEDAVKNAAKQSSLLGEGKVPFGEHSRYVTPIKYEDENVAKTLPDGKVESVTFDINSEYLILADYEDALNAMNVSDVVRNSVADCTDHVDDVTVVQLRDNGGVIRSSAELNNEGIIAGSSVHIKEHKIAADIPFMVNFLEYAIKDGRDTQPPIQVKEKVFARPEKDAFFDHTVNIHSSEEYSTEGPNKNVGSKQAKVVYETYDGEENNIQIIKSTVKLLQAQFEDMSHGTGSVLPCVALATELEQNLFRLQDSITQCEVQKSDFCAQLKKGMKVSVVKLKEMAERLVDDIDEQLYKLLSRIVRKLKKFKENLQDNWCHMAHKYVSKNDAVYNWLHSSVLLECKESKRHTKKKKFKEFSFKEPSRLKGKFVRSTSDGNYKGMDEPNIFKIHNTGGGYNGFKSGDSITASEEGQRSGMQYILTQTDYVIQSHINEKHVPDKVIVNHDNLNEEHFKITVPEAFEKSKDEEQYMSELHTIWKHDNQGTFKNHFNEEEKNKSVNKHKNVPLANTCWQTYNGKTVCKRFKNNQFLHSEKLKDQYDAQSHRDNNCYEKKNLKSQCNDKNEKEYKKIKIKHNWQDESKHLKHLILEQDASWDRVDTSGPKHNNISGDWVLKMGNSRAMHRKLERKSDWLFERADARKMQRERQHVTGNWYFERAHGRAYCRFHPHSNWCKTGTCSDQNYDRPRQSGYENDYSEDDRFHRVETWYKKFILHTSHAAKKLMKHSFSCFQNKMNCHNHH